MLMVLAPLPCKPSQSLRKQNEDRHQHRHQRQHQRQRQLVTRRRETQPTGTEAAMPKLSRAPQQQQQQQRIIQQDANNNNNNNNNNECSLCQELTLLGDKIPNPQASNATCADMDYYYQSDSFVTTAGGAYSDGSANASISSNTPGTCRSDLGFNFYFDMCCKASIPKYECEQNIHDLILGDNNINNYNTAVPPIVDAENRLIVSVPLQYEALEHIEVEEGTILRCGCGYVSFRFVSFRLRSCLRYTNYLLPARVTISTSCIYLFRAALIRLNFLLTCLLTCSHSLLLGTATIFVSMTLKWVDPRLKWDVFDYDTCSNMIDVYTGM